MKEIFCEILDKDAPDDVYRVYTDGSLDLFSPPPANSDPKKANFFERVRKSLEELAQDRVAREKIWSPGVFFFMRGYRSRFPEAFATLCAFMRQGPPFEPDEEEEYDEDDEILQYTVVPRVENPWEDDPDFDPYIIETRNIVEQQLTNASLQKRLHGFPAYFTLTLNDITTGLSSVRLNVI